MYNPPAFAVADLDQILEALRRVALGQVISLSRTDDGDRLESSAMPFVIDDELGFARGHLARANRHGKHLDGADVLMLVVGPNAYVTPSWYPSKAEHGKVVPTWNYELVEVRGVAEVHDDPEWKRTVVTDLTNQAERAVTDPTHQGPWAVDDAPADFIEAQLKAIVGIGVRITSIEAKHKLSQNRPSGDQHGVAAGLARSTDLGAQATAALMTPPPAGDEASL